MVAVAVIAPPAVAVAATRRARLHMTVVTVVGLPPVAIDAVGALLHSARIVGLALGALLVRRHPSRTFSASGASGRSFVPPVPARARRSRTLRRSRVSRARRGPRPCPRPAGPRARPRPPRRGAARTGVAGGERAAAPGAAQRELQPPGGLGLRAVSEARAGGRRAWRARSAGAAHRRSRNRTRICWNFSKGAPGGARRLARRASARPTRGGAWQL